MEFSRQEYLGGLPFPSPWDLPDPGIKPRSLALQADSLPTKPPGKIPYIYVDKRILMLCMYMCVRVCVCVCMWVFLLAAWGWLALTALVRRIITPSLPPSSHCFPWVCPPRPSGEDTSHTGCGASLLQHDFALTSCFISKQVHTGG